MEAVEPGLTALPGDRSGSLPVQALPTITAERPETYHEHRVCIKQVPDVPSIRIDRERMTIIREGVESVINPLDYVALQSALDVRDKEGGVVTVMTMGPAQSEAALREAIALWGGSGGSPCGPRLCGCGHPGDLPCPCPGHIHVEPAPDLVLCGMQTIDSDTGHVGPQLAEELKGPAAGVRRHRDPSGKRGPRGQADQRRLPRYRQSAAARLAHGGQGAFRTETSGRWDRSRAHFPTRTW